MKPKFLVISIVVLVSIPLSIAGYSIATRTNTRSPELQAQTAKANAEVRGAAVNDVCSGKTSGSKCAFTSPEGNDISGTCGSFIGEELTCAPAGNPAPQ